MQNDSAHKLQKMTTLEKVLNSDKSRHLFFPDDGVIYAYCEGSKKEKSSDKLYCKHKKQMLSSSQPIRKVHSRARRSKKIRPLERLQVIEEEKILQTTTSLEEKANRTIPAKILTKKRGQQLELSSSKRSSKRIMNENKDMPLRKIGSK